MVIILVEVTWYKATDAPQETFQWLVSICGGKGMRTWLSLIPASAISVVSHAQLPAVYRWVKNKGKHIPSSPLQYFLL